MEEPELLGVCEPCERVGWQSWERGCSSTKGTLQERVRAGTPLVVRVRACAHVRGDLLQGGVGGPVLRATLGYCEPWGHLGPCSLSILGRWACGGVTLPPTLEASPQSRPGAHGPRVRPSPPLHGPEGASVAEESRENWGGSCLYELTAHTSEDVQSFTFKNYEIYHTYKEKNLIF